MPNSAVFVRFVIVGLIGFLVDSSGTLSLIALGMSPFLARPPAILAAMTATWLLNRQFTFQVKERRSASEAIRYAAVAIAAALLNYGAYSLFILWGLPPFPAVALATGIQVGFSFVGYRRFAFRAAD
jgi:putative flippase GtrA